MNPNETKRPAKEIIEAEHGYDFEPLGFTYEELKAMNDRAAESEKKKKAAEAA